METNAPYAGHELKENGFRLGDLRIEPLAGEVIGRAGNEKLDPKVMDVLVVLARQAGQVVLREQLLAELWPNTVVTDDALTRCIYELRRQLSQSAGDALYKSMVETVPKRGYRLNGEVTPLERRSLVPAMERRRARWIGPALAIPACLLALYAFVRPGGGPGARPTLVPPAATGDSIAILPFVDLSPGQDQRYFSDGIAEEILDRLAQVRNLRVIARTSSFAFRDRPLDIRNIAARLSVDYVLEGSVRRSADHVRITTQLIAAASNAHIWSASYDRQSGELFKVQDEIADAVASALQLTLASQKTARAEQIPEAHERYLRGAFFYNRRARGDVELSIKYYQEALVIDPEYALAWAALSAVYGLQVFDDPANGRSWLDRQGEAARKAVELDPQLSAAHERLAVYYMYTGNRNEARRHYNMASALNPDTPSRLGLGTQTWQGDFTAAVADERRKVTRDPLSAAARMNLGLVLIAAGQLDQAELELRKSLEMNPDDRWDAELEIARIRILQGRLQEAENEIARLTNADSRDHIRALLYRAPGGRAPADAALRRLSARPVNVANVRLAEVYAWRGQNDDAFTSLQRQMAAIRNDSGSALPAAPRIYYLQQELRVSPFLKPLHADPRWTTLLADPYES